MKSDDFDPDREELGAWFDALQRKQAKIKSSISLREFFEMVEELLPGEEGLHESIEEQRHPPASLSEAVSNFTEADKRSIAVFKRKLMDQEEVLKKRALKLKIKKGRWWKVDEDSKGSASKQKKKRGDAVNAVEVSAADARYDQVMDMMTKVLQGQKDTDDKICAMTEKQEEEKKQKEELSWEARAKEQEQEIARLKAQAAGGGGVARGGTGQGGGQGQGGAGYGQSGGYQPMGQTPGSPDYTGCNRCGSMEHKGMDCPRNPRNRQQGGYQQGGYQRFSGAFQGRFGQGGGGGY